MTHTHAHTMTAASGNVPVQNPPESLLNGVDGYSMNNTVPIESFFITEDNTHYRYSSTTIQKNIVQVGVCVCVYVYMCYIVNVCDICCILKRFKDDWRGLKRLLLYVVGIFLDAAWFISKLWSSFITHPIINPTQSRAIPHHHHTTHHNTLP